MALSRENNSFQILLNERLLSQTQGPINVPNALSVIAAVHNYDLPGVLGREINGAGAAMALNRIDHEKLTHSRAANELLTNAVEELVEENLTEERIEEGSLVQFELQQNQSVHGGALQQVNEQEGLSVYIASQETHTPETELKQGIENKVTKSEQEFLTNSDKESIKLLMKLASSRRMIKLNMHELRRADWVTLWNEIKAEFTCNDFDQLNDHQRIKVIQKIRQYIATR